MASRLSEQNIGGTHIDTIVIIAKERNLKMASIITLKIDSGQFFVNYYYRENDESADLHLQFYFYICS